MKLYAISDTHGILEHIRLTEPVDVLCIAGDWSPLKYQSNTKEMKRWIQKTFIPWLQKQPANHIIFIAGNHDFITEAPGFGEWINETLYNLNPKDHIHYLCNSSITLYDTTFWGCPYSDLPNWAWYSGGNPKSYEPPEGTDIMIVHAAPDWNKVGTAWLKYHGECNFGSGYLTAALQSSKVLPKLLLCGHIHSGDHAPSLMGNPNDGECLILNVASKNEEYMEWYDPALITFTMTTDKTATAITVEHWYKDELVDTTTEIIHTPLKLA